MFGGSGLGLWLVLVLPVFFRARFSQEVHACAVAAWRGCEDLTGFQHGLCCLLAFAVPRMPGDMGREFQEIRTS